MRREEKEIKEPKDRRKNRMRKEEHKNMRKK